MPDPEGRIHINPEPGGNIIKAIGWYRDIEQTPGTGDRKDQLEQHEGKKQGAEQLDSKLQTIIKLGEYHLVIHHYDVVSLAEVPDSDICHPIRRLTMCVKQGV